MKKDDYENYERVSADVIKSAVEGDDYAYQLIFKRYEGDIVIMLEHTARKMNVPVSYFPIDDFKQSVWINLRDSVRKFRPV